MKNKGFTLVETIIGAILGIMLIGSATYGINQFQEKKDLDDRVGSTASQMVTFAEASYDYASSVGGLEEDIIDVDDLKAEDIINENFSAITPYGQEIKSFVIKNPSEDYYDILVTTTGEPDPNFISRSGQTEGTFNKIQQDTYHSIRRVEMNLDGREYHAGLIKNSIFNSEGNIHRRDISSFNADISEDTYQPSILLVAPEKATDNEDNMQAIWAEPSSNVPANNKAEATVLVGIRKQDGSPVTNKEVEWFADSGTLSSQRTLTNDEGVAEVKIRNNEEKNTIVKASFEGNEMSANVNFVGAEIDSMSASPQSNVNADGDMCSRVEAIARYPDGTIASDENIQWSTTLGNYNSTITKTDAQGKVVSCLTSNTEGVAQSETSVARFNNSDSISIQFIGPRIQSTDISASPSNNLRNDGSHYSTITVKATYPDGSAASGTTIRWNTSRGNLNRTASTTNSRGETSVRLTSNSAGNASVRATVPSGQSVSTTVGFKAPVLHSIARNKAEIDANNSDRATLSARVRYMPENVPAKNGHSVRWSTTRGSLDSSRSNTNTSGIATNRIRSNQEGIARITASYGGVSKNITIKIVKSRVCTPGEIYSFIGNVGPGNNSGNSAWVKINNKNQKIYTYCKVENYHDCWSIGIYGTTSVKCTSNGKNWVEGPTLSIEGITNMTKIRNQELYSDICKANFGVMPFFGFGKNGWNNLPNNSPSKGLCPPP